VTGNAIQGSQKMLKLLSKEAAGLFMKRCFVCFYVASVCICESALDVASVRTQSLVA